MKWNSELDRVFKAEIKTGGYNQIFDCVGVSSLTFAALILGNEVLTLQIVQSEDILHLSVSVDNGAVTVLLASLDLLHEEVLNVVRLLVRQKGSQVLGNT